MSALPTVAVRGRALAVPLPWPGGLWRDRDFMRLFVAQSVSLAGSEVSLIALPLTAVLVLGAGSAQMGLLAAAEKVPYLLVGLLAGVWVDRLRCRSVLVAADVSRAVLLGSIPVAAIFGVLRMEQLFVVALLAGILTVFFDVAYQSYLPEIVSREQLADGNSKLEASKSVAELAGPMLGSGLLQIVTAPLAIVVDAVSFLLSGLFIHSIRANEQPVVRDVRSSMLADVAAGIRLVVRHPLLRATSLCSATMNLFYQMLMAVYILYVTTQLLLPPALVGIVVGIGSVAGLAGALVASRIASRIGPGWAMMASTIVSATGALGIALTQSGGGLATALALVGSQLLLLFGVPIYNINQVSLRQAITPAGLRGRVNATNRCLVWSTMPIGSLTGGLLGQAIGLQATIVVAGAGMLLAVLWVALSPARHLKSQDLRSLEQLA